MSIFCSNCGHRLELNDAFCPNCGMKRRDSVEPNTSQQNVIYQQNYTQSKIEEPYDIDNDYVEFTNTTSKINPNIKTRTEIVIQGLTIGCIVISAVLAMLALAMVISENVVKGVFSDGIDVYYSEGVSSQSFFAEVDTSSDEVEWTGSTTAADNENVSVYTTVTTKLPSRETTSSTTKRVTTTTIAKEMQASYLKQKIAGKWTTNLPYKTMKVPAVFTFDSNGKCSCVIKALFITKKFDGSYTVIDGGACSITLIGLEDYVGGTNTMSGNIKFLSDNKVNFVSGDTTWELVRTN